MDQIYLEWINCSSPIKKISSIKELSDGSVFIHLLKKIGYSCKISDKTEYEIIYQFIRDNFPHYDIDKDDWYKNETELKYVSLLFLIYITLKHEDIHLKHAFSTNLSTPSQVFIKEFLEKILAADQHITKSVIVTAVNSVDSTELLVEENVTFNEKFSQSYDISTPRRPKRRNSTLLEFFQSPNTLKRMLDEKTLEYKRLRIELENEIMEKMDLIQQSEDCKKSIQTLNKQLLIKTAENKKLNEDIQQLQYQINTTVQSKSDYEIKEVLLEKTQEEVKELESYVSKLEREVCSFQDEIFAYKKQIHTLSEVEAVLKEENQLWKSSSIEHENRNKHLEHTLSSLQSDYALVNEMLHELRTENDLLKRECASSDNGIALETELEIQENKRLKEELSRVSDEKDNVLKSFCDLENHLTSLQDAVQELRADKTALTNQLEEKSKLVESLQSRFNDILEEVEEVKKSNLELRDRCSEYELEIQENKRLKEELSRVSDEKDNVLKSFCDLENHLKSLRNAVEELRVDKTGLTNQLEEKSKLVKSLQSRLNDILEEVEEVKKSNLELRDRCSEYELEIHANKRLKDELSRVSDEKDNVLKSFCDLENHLKSLQDAVQELRADKTALTNQLEEKSKLVESLQSRFNDILEEVEEVKQSKFELRDRCLKYESIIEEISRDYDSISDKYRFLNSSLDDVKKLNDELISTKIALETDLNNDKRTIGEKEELISALGNRLKQFEQDCIELRAKNCEQVEQLQMTKESAENLTSEKQKLVQELNSKHERIDELESVVNEQMNLLSTQMADLKEASGKQLKLMNYLRNKFKSVQCDINNNIDSKISELTDKIDLVNRTLSHVESHGSEQITHISNLESANEELESRLKSESSIIKNLTEQLSDKERIFAGAIDKFGIEYDEIRIKYGSLDIERQSQLETLINSLNEANGKYRDANQTVFNLKNEKESLIKELEDKKGVIDRLQNEKVQLVQAREETSKSFEEQIALAKMENDHCSRCVAELCEISGKIFGNSLNSVLKLLSSSAAKSELSVTSPSQATNDNSSEESDHGDDCCLIRSLLKRAVTSDRTVDRIIELANRLNNNLIARNQLLEDRNEEIERLKLDLSKSELSRLDSERSLNDRNEQLSGRVDELKSENERLKNEATSQKECFDNLLRTMSDMEVAFLEKLEHLENDKRDLQQTYSENVVKYERDINELISDMSDNRIVHDLMVKVDSLRKETEKCRLDEVSKKVSDEMNRLRCRVIEFVTGQMSYYLENNDAVFSDDCETEDILENVFSAVISDRTQQSNRINALEMDKNALTNDLEKTNLVINNLNNELRSVRYEKELFQNDIEQLSTEKRSLREELETVKQLQVVRLSNQLTEFGNRLATERLKVKQFRIRLEELSEQNNVLQKSLDVAESRIDEFIRESREELSKKNELVETIDKLYKKLTTVREEYENQISSLERQLNSSAETNDRLKCEVKSMRDVVDELSVKIERSEETRRELFTRLRNTLELSHGEEEENGRDIECQVADLMNDNRQIRLELKDKMKYIEDIKSKVVQLYDDLQETKINKKRTSDIWRNRSQQFEVCYSNLRGAIKNYVSRLRTEKDGLEKLVNEEREKSKSLECKVFRLRDEMAVEAIRQQEEVQEWERQLTKRKTEYESELICLSDKLKHSELEVENLHNSISDLRLSNDRLLIEQGNLQRELANSKLRVESLNSERIELLNKYDKLKQEHEVVGNNFSNELSAYENRIAVMQNDLTSLRESNRELTERLNRSECKNRELEANYNEETRRRDVTRTLTAAKSDELNRLRKELETVKKEHQSDIVQFTSQLNHADHNCEKLTKENNNLKESNKILQRDKESLEKNLNVERESNEKLSLEVNQLLEKLNKSDKYRQEIELKITEMYTKLQEEIFSIVGTVDDIKLPLSVVDLQPDRILSRLKELVFSAVKEDLSENKMLKLREQVTEKIRQEYDGKLQRAKTELKTVFLQQQQELGERWIKKEKEYKCQIHKQKEHIETLSSQFWDISDKYLKLKQMNSKRESVLSSVSNISPKNSLSPSVLLKKSKSANNLNSWEYRVGNVGLDNLGHEDRVSDYFENAPKQLRRRAPTTIGKVFPTADEESEVFDNAALAELKEESTFGKHNEVLSNRLSVLQARNSMYKPHLKSSYPIETQFISPSALNEEEIKMGCNGNIIEDNDIENIPPQENYSRKNRNQTSYKKPGPPTPSKNGGRLFQQNAGGTPQSKNPLRESNQIVSISGNSKRKSFTPSKLFNLFSSRGTAAVGTSSFVPQAENFQNNGTPHAGRLHSIRKRFSKIQDITGGGGSVYSTFM